MVKAIAPGLALLAVALQGQATTKATTCVFDGGQAARLASRKGYEFSAKASQSATCQVRRSGEILVVSASGSSDASCSFGLFIPPEGTQLSIMRAALKSATGDPMYVQRKGDGSDGLTVSLTARKGQTLQFRITEVEIQIAEGACEDQKLGDLL